MPASVSHHTRIVTVSFRSVAIAAFVIVTGAMSQASVEAQVSDLSVETDGTVTQRRLPLPTNGSGNLQQQLFLMKQLRSLLMGPQADPNNSQPSADPSQSDRLRDQLKGLKDRIPPDMLPLLENLPPGLIEQTMKDPEIKQQMKELLEQYSRDRQIPQGSGRQRLPLPESPNRQSDLNISPNAEQQNPDVDSSPPRNSPRTPSPPQVDPSNRRQPQSISAPESMDSQDQPENSNGSTQAALQRLRDFWNQQPENKDRQIPAPARRRTDRTNSSTAPRQTSPSAPGSPTNSAPRPAADSRQSGNADSGNDGPAGSEFPDNQRDWDQLLEDLIRQQQGAPFGTESSAAENAQNDSRGATRNADRSSPRVSGTRSVQEFLEMMKDVAPPGPSTSNTDTAPNPSSESAAETAEPAAEEVRRKQQDAKDNLQKFGLQQTLRRIVKDAQKEARQKTSEAPGGNDAASGESGRLSESMLKAVKGISRNLIEIVKDGKFKFNESGKTADSAASRPQPSAPPTPPTPTQSVLREIRDSTTEFLSDIATPPAPTPPDRAANDVPTITDVVSGRSAGQWLTALAVLILLAGLLFWRITGIDPAAAVTAGGRFLSGDDVKSKADVIRAYHRMALNPKRPTQRWWTHQMVAHDICQSSPDKTYQIQVLTELYELARYLPQDEDLTPEQILEAQTALQRCEA